MISMKLIIVIALFGLVATKSYEGYHVIDVNPKTGAQVHFLQNLLVNDVNIDFWEIPSHVGKRVRMMISGDYLQHSLSKKLAYNRLPYTVFNDNVEATVQRERDEIAARRATRNQAFDIDDFNTLADIHAWLSHQDMNICPGVGLTCSMNTVGYSYEGKNIFALTVTANPGAPIIYMDSTTHAREWLTPATNLKIINHLISGYGLDSEVTNLLDTREWRFVVLVNPDGYDYSWTDDRYLRKNRAPTENPDCIGTDLNRNFDFRWGQNGVSFDPCSDNYCGNFSGSEVETQAISNYLRTIGDNVWAMVTLHSYGNYWMHPWGTTTQAGNDNAPCDLVADHDDLFAVAEAAGLALEATGGDTWNWGNSCLVTFTASGTSDDYAKGAANIKYVFNAELRGNDYAVPKRDIELSFQEIWAALVAMDAAIAANPPF